MAQTRKRRQTKHRGNAAGMVEARGRTGRPGGPVTPKLTPKEEAKQRRIDRMNQPPTWKGALNRAAIATLVFVVLVLVLFRQSLAQAVALGAFMFLVYIPLGYYTDKFMWTRRQKKKAA